MEPFTVVRTTSENKDFRSLVLLLDQELAIRDGAQHDFYHQFNGIANLQNCIVSYLENSPVGIGVIKPFDEDTVEIKRMFTVETSRGKGSASLIMKNLEKWAAELGYKNCILETGINQPEAIQLYKKTGYRQIENYGQYIGVEESLCFKKGL